MKNNSIKISILLLILVFFISCSKVKINKEGDYALLRGINFSQQENYEKAMEEYQKSFDINPQNIILLKEMGYTYYQFGNYKKAEEYWLMALSIDNKDENLIKNLVTLYYEMGEYSKSREIIKNSYNPKAAYYKKIDALINYRENKLEESYKLFKEINVEELDEKSILIYFEILKKLNKKEELYYLLKSSYPYFSKDKRYLIEYSKILSNDYQLNDESEKVLLNYLIENGNDDEILLQLSMLYLKMGKKDKSDQVFKLIYEKEIFNLNY